MGRFCLNCGHPVGEPVADEAAFIPWEEETLTEAEQRLVEESTSPLPWLPWVLGAVALVVVVLLLASWLGYDEPEGERAADSTSQEVGGGDAPAGGAGDGEKAEDEGEGDGDGEDEVRAPARPRSLASAAVARAPETAPPTTDLDGQLVAYVPQQMLDGTPVTAWRMAGDGTGTQLTFTLARESVVTRVGLINGYAKQISGVDWYPHNRRVLAARWSFDDGTTVAQPLSEIETMQTIDVDPVRTRKLVLTLVTVSAPGSGTLGRDYTVVSEVDIVGGPAR